MNGTLLFVYIEWNVNAQTTELTFMVFLFCLVSGWRQLGVSMILVATAMLCKEQGITVTGVCAVYEIFVAQKVSVLLRCDFCNCSQ